LAFSPSPSASIAYKAPSSTLATVGARVNVVRARSNDRSRARRGPCRGVAL
jgi:hypothetical protein